MSKHELRLNDTFQQDVSSINSALESFRVLTTSTALPTTEKALVGIPEILQNANLKDITLTPDIKCWNIYHLSNEIAVDGKLTTDSLGKFGLALANFKERFDKVQNNQPSSTLKEAIENIIQDFETETFNSYITSSLTRYINLYHKLKQLNPSISKKAIIRTLHAQIKPNENEEVNASKNFPAILNNHLEATYVIEEIEEFSLKTQDKADATTQSLTTQLKELTDDYFHTKLALEIHGNKNNLPKDLKPLEETYKEIKEKIEAYKKDNPANLEQLGLLDTLLQILAKLLPEVILSKKSRENFFFKRTKVGTEVTKFQEYFATTAYTR